MASFCTVDVLQQEILIELHPPTVEPLYEDVRQKLGGTVTLSCKMVSGNPLRVTSVTWTFNGNRLETPPAEPQLESMRQINQLTAKQYGTYQCILANDVSSGTCLFNLSGRAYPPEFYYDTPNPVRIQKPNLYLFILQWTQKLPYAVGNVLEYKLLIQQEWLRIPHSLCSWIPILESLHQHLCKVKPEVGFISQTPTGCGSERGALLNMGKLTYTHQER
ncbi:MAM domain-containing glycosylphosphatidylinositol anchor protein 1-like [Rhincodon typus]|uniref:MAM domain-containing glycosylphosphatidylinositol anchor protein 1-like n=1 Tax=Rhincodon typus TaxID=259920 RepID=UPI0020307D2A|nr:MAM domain-containing glycosylphosphatidylinositol anchor protein 1-like [Rhincodon typus]